MKKAALILFAILLTTGVSAQIYIPYKIYAGENHETYIGKWASPYDPESIWNKYSKYGSKYNSNSIWNKYGPYGSKYNAYSPWNAYSTKPPVLVDDNNKVVGYLTCGYKASKEIREVLKYVLEHFDEVANDPTAFYKENKEKMR